MKYHTHTATNKHTTHAVLLNKWAAVLPPRETSFSIHTLHQECSFPFRHCESSRRFTSISMFAEYSIAIIIANEYAHLLAALTMVRRWLSNPIRDLQILVHWLKVDTGGKVSPSPAIWCSVRWLRFSASRASSFHILWPMWHLFRSAFRTSLKPTSTLVLFQHPDAQCIGLDLMLSPTVGWVSRGYLKLTDLAVEGATQQTRFCLKTSHYDVPWFY